MTRFGRRDENLPDLMAEAALAALADAGIERPEALVVAAMNPEEFTGEGNYASLIATRLGLSQVPALRVETATSSGVAAVYSAYAAIAAGFHRSILVVGGEKMTHVATPRVSEIIGRSIDPHEKSYGTTMPALAGLVTRAAMHRRGFTLREISQVAVKNHAHGARNPYAHFQEPVKLEAVMESRLVADPLRLFHCCPISDGGAALVLTAEPRAVRIAGIGQGADSIAVRYRERPHVVPGHPGGRAGGVSHGRLRRRAGRGGRAARRLHPVRADLARGHRPRASRQGGPRHPRRRDRGGRPAADQPVGRAEGAGPPAGRDRHLPDRRAVLAAPRQGRGPPGPRAGRRWPSRSAGSPPTTG